jgi:hypothetical protein
VGFRSAEEVLSLHPAAIPASTTAPSHIAWLENLFSLVIRFSFISMKTADCDELAAR